jgi:hypothetical protein
MGGLPLGDLGNGHGHVVDDGPTGCGDVRHELLVALAEEPVGEQRGDVALGCAGVAVGDLGHGVDPWPRCCAVLLGVVGVGHQDELAGGLADVRVHGDAQGFDAHQVTSWGSP